VVIYDELLTQIQIWEPSIGALYFKYLQIEEHALIISVFGLLYALLSMERRQNN
jgi:hypothetical protein